MDWQPIETAPKDGTRVLVGRFTGNKAKGDHDGYMAVDRYRHPEDGDGYTGFGLFNQRHWPPTHWMPLPPPPAA